jgi:hypothetical protein
MVANLAKPTPERPALMTHDGMEHFVEIQCSYPLISTIADAVTFFHEFGHAVHGLLSRTQFSKFHGTRFVSAVPVVPLGARSFALIVGVHLQRREGFRRGSLTDAGELGLGTQSAQEDFEPLQESRTFT